MLKIRRPLGRLIFNMGIAIPGKTVFLIETAPWWCKWLKSFLMEERNTFIQHNQYHGCWWPGDIRSQGIRSHGIDLFFLEYSSLTTRRVRLDDFFFFFFFFGGGGGALKVYASLFPGIQVTMSLYVPERRKMSPDQQLCSTKGGRGSEEDFSSWNRKYENMKSLFPHDPLVSKNSHSEHYSIAVQSFDQCTHLTAHNGPTSTLTMRCLCSEKSDGDSFAKEKFLNMHWFNPSPPGQNGCDFADDIFIYIFVNETFCILIKISLKFCS